MYSTFLFVTGNTKVVVPATATILRYHEPAVDMPIGEYFEDYEGKLLAYLDADNCRRWHKLWKQLDLSGGAVQVHFLYEDDIFFYLDFHPQGLFLCIYPQLMFFRINTLDYSSPVAEADTELYKSSWNLITPLYNRILPGKCEGQGGHPLCLFRAHPKDWEEDMWDVTCGRKRI